MIDASHIKVHPHGAGAKGGNQLRSRTTMGLTPRYIWLWMRMVCRLESLSLSGTGADCTQALRLVEAIDAQALES